MSPEVFVNEPLAEMFRYNRWANVQLLEACRSLSEEQLEARLTPESRSVRELLSHIVNGQLTLVLRTQGRQHEGEDRTLQPWPGFDKVIQIAGRSSDELIGIAERLQDTEVRLPYLGKVFSFPKRFFLVHAMEHGVEHRTEVKATLRAIGVDTPDLDGWPYSIAAGFGQEVEQ